MIVINMTSRGIFSRQNIFEMCFSFVKCVSDVTFGGGVFWGTPLDNFWLNGVKSCNFRQYKHGNGTFMKARDSVYEGGRDNPLNLEVMRIFLIFTLCLLKR